VGTAGVERAWRPGFPVDLDTTLSALRRSSYDPTYHREPCGAIWRTARTPDGSGTVRFKTNRLDGTILIHTWGPGAQWLLDAGPDWLGRHDDPDSFQPVDPVLRELFGLHPGWRVGRTNLVMEALVPAILEQKVTGREAWHGWRTLLRWYGDEAPGPVPDGMRVFPSPETWRTIPSWKWHKAGVGPDRSRTVIRAARVADRLEEVADLPADRRAARLRTVPGVGEWTAAEVLQRACGDADAVSVGDFHLPRLVVHALTGRVSDSDEEMLELLEPYRGHRYRVTRLLEMSGVRTPRFGPRLAVRDYRAM